MRPIFLPRTAALTTHPGVTTQPGSRSKGSIVAWAAFAVVAATGVDAVSSALQGLWFEAGACAAFDVLLVGLWHAQRAWNRHQCAQRWRHAVQRRDELQRQRAEAVRLHRSVAKIDAELQPLVHRMMAGAI